LIGGRLPQDKLIAFLIIRRCDEADRSIRFTLGEFRSNSVITFFEDLRLCIMHRDFHIRLGAQLWRGEQAGRDAQGRAPGK
jgi:hypothetical protein